MSFDISDNTTTNTTEFKPDAYVIPFAPELINFILQNLKMTTYRFGRKYDYINIGDTVTLQNSTTKEIVAKAIITDKSSTTFKDLPLNSGTHESYKDKEHQRIVHSGYYAYIGRSIEDDDEYLVFDFKLIES